MTGRLTSHGVSNQDKTTTQASGQIACADAHVGACDALLRFAAGTDDGDLAMLKSAFAEDAVVDFSACGRALGVDFEPLQGATTITGFLAGTSKYQVTSHVVTNSRVLVKDEHAWLRALVDASHIVRADRAHRFRMMNWYDADLIQVEGGWRIERMVIDNIWFEGDPAILMVRESPAS